MFNKIIEKQFLGREDILDNSILRSIYSKNSNEPTYKFFQIIDNKLYVKSNFFYDYETRFEAAKANILSILDKYRIPDMEFIYFDGDSLNTKDPILVSTSCNENSNVILLPDFAFQFWPETHLFDYRSDMEKIFKSADLIGTDINGWKKKKDVIFYRGSMNNEYRSKYISNEMFMDTKSIVGFQSPRGNPNFIIDDNKGCTREHKSNYKFLLHLNGGLDSDYSSAFRFNLACCSLVFYATNLKQREWWQDNDIFIDGKHYISVTSMEDLKHKFNYYIKEEEEAFNIAKSGFDFVKKYLNPETVEIYYRDVLIKYSSILKYKIELLEGAILIENYNKPKK